MVEGPLDDRPGDVGVVLAADVSGMVDEEARLHLLALHVLMARVDAATVAATGALERRRLFEADAARSAAGWLAGRVDQTRGQCARDVKLARVLGDMPLVEAAAGEGRMGRVKVDLLAEARQPEVVGVFALHEEMLVTQVERLTVRDARRFLQAWLEQARLSVGWTDPDEPVDGSEPPAAVVDLAQTFDGRWSLAGELDPVEGTELASAIAAEVDHMFHLGSFRSDDGLSPRERRGIAFMQIVTRQARPQSSQGVPRPSVEVICDERTLLGVPVTDPEEDGGEDLRRRVCELVNGTPVSLATLGRLLCGADVHRLVVSAVGEVLDAGKTIRLANRAQRRALRYRHARHCGFPGCDAPVEWCEFHHVEPWDPDPDSPCGRTDLANLVPLCRFHHHRVHEGHFTLVLDPDGWVEVLRPPDQGGRRCPITPAKAHHRPLEPHPDALLVRERARELVATRS